MKDINSRSWGRTLVTNLTTAALIATLMPMPALAATDTSANSADEIVLLDGSVMPVDETTAAEDADTLTNMDEPATGDSSAQSIGVSAGNDTQAIDGSADNGAQTLDGSAGIDAQAGAPTAVSGQADDSAAASRQAAPSESGKHAAADNKQNNNSAETVSYLKRGWDGKKVTESVEPCNEAKPLPENGKLNGGWYIVSADRAYGERMEVTGDTHLILGDGCTLSANAGIYVAQGSTLSIYGGPNETGALVAHAKKGAGIGAYSGHKGGDIVIHSGRVTATAGKHCAGIGSNDGDSSEVGTITIYGGEVTATGGNDGAGIGGGRKSSAKVTIYGGTVTANGKEDGAGIGSGEDSNSGSIVIRGGKVTANADTQGAGIGAGNNGSGNTIEISGGEVHANSGGDGAAIGGGEDGDSGSITISGGTVNALGAKNGAGIGGGNHSGDGNTITLSGGTVISESEYGAGVGGGRAAPHSLVSRGLCKSNNSGDGGNITISGGDVTITSKKAYGIGAGHCASEDDCSDSYIGNASKIVISNATVNAKGRLAAIGGDDGTIDINSGNVTLSGYVDRGAGIQLLDKDAKVNIRGGHIDATGIGDPGINMSHGYNVTITGGEVNAKSNSHPGIGEGWHNAHQGTLTISGKNTRVKSSSDTAAGIGAFDDYVHGKIVLKDGATLVAESSKGKAFDVANIKLYDEAKVIAGADESKATVCPAADRVKACKNSKAHYAAITPCDHPNATHEPHESGHTTQCPNCASKLGEAH